MAFLSARKTGTKVKPSMQEEIDEENIAELVGRNMTETTEAIKEQFKNRTKFEV